MKISADICFFVLVCQIQYIVIDMIIPDIQEGGQMKRLPDQPRPSNGNLIRAAV